MGKNKDNKKYNRKTIHLIHLKPLLKCFNRKNAQYIYIGILYTYLERTHELIYVQNIIISVSTLN